MNSSIKSNFSGHPPGIVVSSDADDIYREVDFTRTQACFSTTSFKITNRILSVKDIIPVQFYSSYKRIL